MIGSPLGLPCLCPACLRADRVDRFRFAPDDIIHVDVKTCTAPFAPDLWRAELLEKFYRATAFAPSVPPAPLTRRQWLQVWLRTWGWRIRDAWDVLRGERSVDR